jgi:hypothetical protein
MSTCMFLVKESKDSCVYHIIISFSVEKVRVDKRVMVKSSLEQIEFFKGFHTVPLFVLIGLYIYCRYKYIVDTAN